MLVTLSCGDRGGPGGDRAALEAFYAATGGSGWTRSDNWLTDLPLREWYGVHTDDRGRVVRHDLSGEWDGGDFTSQDLVGEIPAELASLAMLVELRLGSNGLTGEIPPELGNLAHLELLYLNNNELSGAIPAEVEGLTNLRELYASDNALTGNLPSELGKLSELSRLSVASNPLSGEIPSTLQSLGLELFPLRGHRTLRAGRRRIWRLAFPDSFA